MAANQLQKSDVLTHADVKDIVANFYDEMLRDPIVGFIFTDIAKIELEEHLPIIVNFWTDILFNKNRQQKQYQGNVLEKHLQLNQLINLKAGHFTRWLYLFSKAVDAAHEGPNATLIKDRAERVATTISATISERKKVGLHLVLPKQPQAKLD